MIQSGMLMLGCPWFYKIVLSSLLFLFIQSSPYCPTFTQVHLTIFIHALSYLNGVSAQYVYQM
jgi:hypothetical protein